MRAALKRNQIFEVPWYAMIVQGEIACGVGHRTVKLNPPNGGIVEVRIDGAVLDPSAWRVDNGNELVRQDGKFWPTHQDPKLPDDAVGTFEVTYYRGFRPGPLVVGAVQTLASEFYLAATGKKHRLPSNVTAVSRQGLNFTMKDPVFAEGLTGIAEVDIVIRRYNPYGLMSSTVIASVDSLRAHERTDSAAASAGTSGLQWVTDNGDGTYSAR